MYSPLTNEFTLVAPMKLRRWDLGVCRVGNLVYVMGGKIQEYDHEFGDYHDRDTNSVEVYNLDTDEWRDGVDLPESCSSVFAFATDGTYLESSKEVCLLFLLFIFFAKKTFF